MPTTTSVPSKEAGSTGWCKNLFQYCILQFEKYYMVFVYLGNPLNRLCDRFPLLCQCQARHRCLQRKPVPQGGAITCSQTRAANGWVFWFRKNMLGSFAQWGLIAKPMNSEPDQSSFCRPTTKLRWLPSTVVTKRYRQILGTLKFEGNVAIHRSSFNDLFSKHQVTMEELDELAKGKQSWQSETLWAWHLTLSESLQPPPLLKVSPSNRCNVIWTYFSLDDIVVQNPQESSALAFFLS